MWLGVGGAALHNASGLRGDAEPEHRRSSEGPPVSCEDHAALLPVHGPVHVAGAFRGTALHCSSLLPSPLSTLRSLYQRDNVALSRAMTCCNLSIWQKQLSLYCEFSGYLV